MLKEYCDRCQKEIDNADYNNKKQIKISIPGYYREEYANITLCNDCFKELGIMDAVRNTGTDKYQEKDTNATEQLMGIIRELVSECLDESK